MVFLHPLIDVAIYYATGRSPRSLEKDKFDRLHAIIEDFILNSNITKMELSMQQIVQEGYDPKCIPKIFKILQVRPYTEIDEKPAKGNSPETSENQGNHRHRSAPWSTEEDERLIAGIFHFGFSDWQKVSTFVGKGRSRSQCGQRWLRCLDPNVNKEKWTPEEDASLKHLVDIYGIHSWARIAKELGNRTDVQCRYRYNRCKREIQTFPAPTMPQFPNQQDFFKVQSQILLAAQQNSQNLQTQNLTNLTQNLPSNLTQNLTPNLPPNLQQNLQTLQQQALPSAQQSLAKTQQVIQNLQNSIQDIQNNPKSQIPQQQQLPANVTQNPSNLLQQQIQIPHLQQTNQVNLIETKSAEIQQNNDPNQIINLNPIIPFIPSQQPNTAPK
ncbi:hypothetical protein TRFO_24596 [Tritrichomonas foetus]|uniref:Myb-like DNA-binding domain containing protein n=1 Tax=Tritrichomonas foetus TaxID=1144522 RepID=A0A1J4KCB2_9EUKA|nr:hypothetical protein TRFO_24596 [Tritrichomonas foetus]|eukprot:OHT07324.1 hypothetical protein TRFO_24596 [Tritrichomonas foetus]